jgi:hypothetical protein
MNQCPLRMPGCVKHIQAAGKAGWNFTALVPVFDSQSPAPTPLSPDEKKSETPRAPSCANVLHTDVA